MTDKIQKYRDYEALSYSRLSGLASHPRSLIADEKKESAALNFGSLVDCLMFSPDQFDKQFYRTSFKKPGGEMMKWLDAYLNYELPVDYSLNDTDEIILKARVISGYNKSLKDETALKKFHEECDNYINELSAANGRIIVTNEEFDKAINYQTRLLSNEFTMDYFNEGLFGNLEIKFQHDIYYILEDVPFKSLLDIVVFDHKNKTITPLDLKTTSESVLAFEGEFLKWKYYIQAGLYRKALALVYPDYKILPFKFIIINEFEEPFIWGVDEQLHSVSLLGGMLRSGRKIKGVYQLIEEYKWHESTGKYEYPASYYANDGVKWIDIC